MKTLKYRKRSVLPIALGLAAALWTVPSTAKSFYQTTTVDGTVGHDLSGVWLATYNVMPSFRVRIDTEPDVKAPWTVGPIPKDLAPLVGDELRGVMITKINDPAVTGKYSIFEGDLITKINTRVVDNVEQYQEALGEVKEFFLANIRRPQLQFSNARLVKIRYSAEEVDVGGVSELGNEKIEVRVLASVLPFAGDIEKARNARSLYEATGEQVEELKSEWYRLEVPAMEPFVQGEHRIVAESDYDQALRSDDNLRETRFAIISKIKGNPLAGQTGENIGIYGVRSVEPDRIAGSYVESTLASAPFPISIDFNGAFSLVRIDEWSDKDLEHLMVLKKAKAGEDGVEEDAGDVELAPDVP